MKFLYLDKGENLKKIGAIVLTYNDAELTKKCIGSLMELAIPSGYAIEVIVIDNGSNNKISTKIQTFLASCYQKVFYIKLDHNLGYGAGMNKGVKHLVSTNSIEYLWFINNDIILENKSLEYFVKYIENHIHKEIIGFTVIDQNEGSIQCGGGCTYNKYLGIEKYNLQGKSLDVLEEIKEINLDYIYGAFFAVSTKYFLNNGGFNEKYFLYYEELELSKNSSKEGLGWCKAGHAYHSIGATASRSINLQGFTTYHAALSSFNFTNANYPYYLPSVIMVRIVGKLFHSVMRQNANEIKFTILALVHFLTGKKCKNIDEFNEKFFKEED